MATNNPAMSSKSAALIDALVSGVLALEDAAWRRDMLRTESHRQDVRAFVTAVINGANVGEWPAATP